MKYRALLADDEASAHITERALNSIQGIHYELVKLKSFEELVAFASGDGLPRDILLLSTSWLNRSCIDILKDLRARSSSLPVIVIAEEENLSLDCLVMECGASDYLVKDNHYPQVLERSIRYSVECSRKMLFASRKLRQEVATSRLAALNYATNKLIQEIDDPLSSIQGYAIAVQTAAQAKIVNRDKVTSGADGILQMTSRIESAGARARERHAFSSRRPLHNTSLSELVARAVEQCRDSISENNIEIYHEIDRDIFVECEAVEISQAIVNLLLKSCHALERHEERWIKISAKEINDECLNLIISYSSKSNLYLEKTNREEIFADSNEKSNEAGVGVEVSKEILQLNGGDLLLDSDTPNMQYIVRLPLKRSKAKTHFDIFVIDDEMSIGELFQEEIARRGHVAKTETNPEVALAHLQHFDYDAVICDIHMDHLSGIELAEKVRLASKASPRFVFISGFVDSGIKIEIAKLGKPLVFEKPFSIREVVDQTLHLLETTEQLT